MDDFYSYNFQQDEIKQEEEYIIENTTYTPLLDNNQKSYVQGYINWTNQSMVGSFNKFFDYSNSYILLPYTITTSLPSNPNAGTFFSFDPTVSYKYAISPKAYHHFIDFCQIKFNGISVNRSSNYNNFYQNELLKESTLDEHRMFHDILNNSYDTGDTIKFTQNVGEVNNVIQTNTTDYSQTDSTNYGFLERLKRNTDMVLPANSLNLFTGQNATLQTDNYQGGIVSVTAQQIVYQGFAYIPMRIISPFFGKLPSIQNSVGLEIRVIANCAQENNYVETIDNGSGAVTNFVSNQVIGNSCVFMHSPYSFDGKSGFKISKPANAAIAGGMNVITYNTQIGWALGNAPPVKIMIPCYQYTNDYSRMILNNAKFNVVFNDFYVDNSLPPIRGGDQVDKLFNGNIAKPRRMFILPYLANSATAFNGQKNPCAPYNSCLTSAPQTVTPVKLRNFQIQIGTQNIFKSAKQFNDEFYLQGGVFNLLAAINGNSMKMQNKDFGGMITKSMWESGGYGGYVIDLKKVPSEVIDSVTKAFQIQFTVDAVNTTYYSFMFIIEYQSNINVDRISGEIIPSS